VLRSGRSCVVYLSPILRRELWFDNANEAMEAVSNLKNRRTFFVGFGIQGLDIHLWLFGFWNILWSAGFRKACLLCQLRIGGNGGNKGGNKILD